MSDSDGSRTMFLSRALTEARARAEQNLWAQMERRGLRQADGWSIVELTREGRGGTQIVLRPLHLRLPAPEDLECTVDIVEDTAGIQMHCSDTDGKSAGA